jgi:chemotaxis protein MotB
MSSDAPKPKAQDAGAPAWVMTFADLMSLLMCFFVLLLSFSEMDVSKYKEMAGSMKMAFGVQRDLKVKEPPKGINVIAREFSPGRPEPTQMNVIRQMTTNDLRINLDLGKERRRPVPTPKAEQEPDKEKTLKPQDSAKNQADQQKAQKAGQKADDKAGAKSGERAHLMPGKQRSQADGLTEAQKKELAEAKALAARRLEEQLKAEIKLAGMQAQQKDKAVSIDEKSLDELVKAKAAAEKQKKLDHNAQLIRQALGSEIKAGAVDVETAGQKIIIRVREKASFGSGRAELKGGFRLILARVSRILKDSEGKIIVAGHTDNVPIYTERFRSNWELSAARAVSVAHEMMLTTNIPSNRFLVQGFADTEPVAKNDNAANRARNRRVEIILEQGDDKLSDKQISASKTQAAPPSDLPATPVKRQTPARLDSTATGNTGPSVKPVISQERPPAKRATTAQAATTKPKTTGATGIKIGGSKADSGEPVPAKSADKPSSSLGIKAGGH